MLMRVVRCSETELKDYFKLSHSVDKLRLVGLICNHSVNSMLLCQHITQCLFQNPLGLDSFTNKVDRVLHIYFPKVHRLHYDLFQPNILAVQFLWNGRRKKIGGFFLRTSPEFDLSVYTICFLLLPGKQCSFHINDNPVTIQTYDLNHWPGLQVWSAFPVVVENASVTDNRE